MTCLALAPPALDAFTGGVDLGSASDHICIVGVYPLHSEERELVSRSGFDALRPLAWDRLDPGRAPAVTTGIPT